MASERVGKGVDEDVGMSGDEELGASGCFDQEFSDFRDYVGVEAEFWFFKADDGRRLGVAEDRRVGRGSGGFRRRERVAGKEMA